MLHGPETSTVTNTSTHHNGIKEGSGSSCGAADIVSIGSSSKIGVCYDQLYRSVSESHPTETEIANRRLMTDVLNFIRSTNNAVKQHISEAARLDHLLQDLAVSYFPETFNNGDLLSESLGYLNEKNIMDPSGESRPKHPLDTRLTFQASQMEVSGKYVRPGDKTAMGDNHSVKSIRMALPVGKIISNMEILDSLTDIDRNQSDTNSVTSAISKASRPNISPTTVPNTDSHPDPRLGSYSLPFLSGARSENLIEIPPSLIGKMPQRIFSAQLKKKDLTVDRKKVFENGGLDPRLRFGSGDH